MQFTQRCRLGKKSKNYDNNAVSQSELLNMSDKDFCSVSKILRSCFKYISVICLRVVRHLKGFTYTVKVLEVKTGHIKMEYLKFSMKLQESEDSLTKKKKDGDIVKAFISPLLYDFPTL